ncbi:MAG: hypothetical protein BGP24_10300 [Lysobacterales bacterium 69-70]|nr:hypothetical protein [Xanthomonadaceae bacterium]ODU33329.1 MAG: hypothetical protein ABS97_13320 [Xanthomonadaceae bacterium SCN 69-320]ODV18002.1 MAG: hypothetical protein ABT27_15290 [Xanthomonadaceae bacterium SCN 69-25]OJZ00872.1 MAG: hypothetical protein BGP24_10300 [Xanthomonadales bacterium 69-70]
MNATIADLVRRLRTLEDELEVQLALARADLQVRVEDGRIAFEQAVQRRHRAMKSRLLRYVFGARALIALTAPLIYALIVPFALLDLFVTIYQAVCFPVYGIAKVRRRDYLVFDRRYLGYLNLLEKLNCAYCSYANGVIAYVREIGARTEQYWCPIKHARRLAAAHPRYANFVDYGDADAWRNETEALRRQLREPPSP